MVDPILNRGDLLAALDDLSRAIAAGESSAQLRAAVEAIRTGLLLEPTGDERLLTRDVELEAARRERDEARAEIHAWRVRVDGASVTRLHGQSVVSAAHRGLGAVGDTAPAWKRSGDGLAIELWLGRLRIGEILWDGGRSFYAHRLTADLGFVTVGRRLLPATAAAAVCAALGIPDVPLPTEPT